VRAVCVCEGGGLRAAFRDDLDRYVFVNQRQHGVTGLLLPLRIGLMSQGLWATMAYRLYHYVRYRLHSRLLGVLTYVLHRIVMALTGIHIDGRAHIGPGLKFGHGGPIIIGPGRIGRNCDIFQYVTLGGSESTLDDSHYDRPQSPTLGDRVHVGPGAVIAGDVTVGDDVAVGANSLVVRDVPPRGVVVGVPARLVSRRGSFAQVMYREMADDDERSVALAADPEADLGRTR
jgi:serine O-acetyltransferase